MITMLCPKCGRAYQLEPDALDKQIFCVECGVQVVPISIPEADRPPKLNVIGLIGLCAAAVGCSLIMVDLIADAHGAFASFSIIMMITAFVFCISSLGRKHGPRTPSIAGLLLMLLNILAFVALIASRMS